MTTAQRKPIYIVSASRTPIGSFLGALSSVPATELGIQVVKHVMKKIDLDPKEVDEVFFGQVVQAGAGQSPARQVSLGAGIPDTTDCTTINKVCASGMKTIMLAAQTMSLGDNECMVAGGMESMSKAPFLTPRQPPTFGHMTAQDSLVVDGLFDVYNKFAMGNCGEHTAKKFDISRESQDDHAIESYRRVERAYAEGKFDAELCPVTIKGRKGEVVVKEDEEYKKVFYDKIRTLRPVFAKEGGSITAANASKLNDGASAVVLMTEEKMKALGVKPLARILGYADAAAAPIDFPTAPTLAIPKALKAAGVSQDDVALFELNEAFSVVVRAAEKIMNLDPAKININGGAVALGHPIGSSGCRIVVTLAHQLKEGEIGVAGVCNGGGAASAMVIQRC
ncbi:hypothetical protein QFC19_005494 [Naganishia cerealis]|uniref:Uncharacterized protein n=1 Tax=Naganishia cerealis TaxID=610337 RepID=A0ACC2VPC7_9TREE|nr:hypothetical protein QFC19_005494 [Naganishia cerealis]